MESISVGEPSDCSGAIGGVTSQPMQPWYDDNAFWDDVAPVVFNEERLKEAPVQVDQILALTRPPSGGAVLDLGCGPGRHALTFARRGFCVTGVDRTARYLDTARQAAEREELDIEWVEADMRQFRRGNAFALAVNLLTTFGYFKDPADDRCVAENLLQSLTPGGHLVVELMGKEVLARKFQRRDWHSLPDGTVVLEERTIKEAWTWIDVCWTILRGDQRREHRFGHRVYSARELTELLTQVGFARIQVYGSLEGAAYDHEAERLAIVAQKPE